MIGLARGLVWVGLTATLCFAGLGCARSERLDSPSHDFSAVTLDGRSLSLSELRGRVVLLNFWGTWCGPCRSEIPGLLDLHRELGPRGLTIVAVSVRDDRDALLAFVKAKGMTFSVVPDTGIADRYQVQGLPTNILVDRKGRMRYRSLGSGFGAVRGLRAVAEELLKEP